MQVAGSEGGPRRVPFKDALAVRLMGGGGTAYSAASQFDRGFASWNPSLRSADAEVLRDHAKARARARDLYRNHPFARQIVRQAALAQIGRLLRYSSRVDYDALGIDEEEADLWGASFDRMWHAYAHGQGAYVDAGRRRNFTAFMRLATRIRQVDGEVLVGCEWDTSRPWNTCFKLIDVDRLSNPHARPDTPQLKAGVALDGHNAPLGYHIRNGHPGDEGLIEHARANTWQYVARETAWGRPVMLHSFPAERAEQTRGITEFTTVIRAMRMQQEFSEADLASAILQAMHALVITSEMDYSKVVEMMGGEVDVDDEGNPINPVVNAQLDMVATSAAYHREARITGFDGGRVVPLLPNEKMQLVTPGNKGSSAAEFKKSAVKEFAAGLGGDPIATSQDYSDVNYSAARMSTATNWRVHEVERGDITYDLGLPMVRCFMEEAVHSGRLALPKGVKPFEFYDALPSLCKGKFLTWGPPMLDPVKERQGQKLGWELGADSLEQICAAEGDDWRENMRQKAREIAFMNENGIPLPQSEGRRRGSERDEREERDERDNA